MQTLNQRQKTLLAERESQSVKATQNQAVVDRRTALERELGAITQRLQDIERLGQDEKRKKATLYQIGAVVDGFYDEFARSI